MTKRLPKLPQALFGPLGSDIVVHPDTRATGSRLEFHRQPHRRVRRGPSGSSKMISEVYCSKTLVLGDTPQKPWFFGGINYHFSDPLFRLLPFRKPPHKAQPPHPTAPVALRPAVFWDVRPRGCPSMSTTCGSPSSQKPQKTRAIETDSFSIP